MCWSSWPYQRRRGRCWRARRAGTSPVTRLRTAASGRGLIPGADFLLILAESLVAHVVLAILAARARSLPEVGQGRTSDPGKPCPYVKSVTQHYTRHSAAHSADATTRAQTSNSPGPSFADVHTSNIPCPPATVCDTLVFGVLRETRGSHGASADPCPGPAVGRSHGGQRVRRANRSGGGLDLWRSLRGRVRWRTRT